MNPGTPVRNRLVREILRLKAWDFPDAIVCLDCAVRLLIKEAYDDSGGYTVSGHGRLSACEICGEENGGAWVKLPGLKVPGHSYVVVAE